MNLHGQVLFRVYELYKDRKLGLAAHGFQGVGSEVFRVLPENFRKWSAVLKR